MALILFIVLLALIVGSLPRAGWPAERYGYYPMGGFGLLIVVLLLLFLLGGIPVRYHYPW